MISDDPFIIDRHDLDALKELFLSKFDEMEKSNDERAKQVEKALDAATRAADRAVTEAKLAADLVSQTLTKRIEQLESGGAPFASRLDEGLTALKADVATLKTDTVKINGEEHRRLKTDVATLNTEAVRSQVLDALREAQEIETKRNRKQFLVAVALLGLASLINFIVNLAQGPVT